MAPCLVLGVLLGGLAACSAPRSPIECHEVRGEHGQRVGRYCAYGGVEGGFQCPENLPVEILPGEGVGLEDIIRICASEALGVTDVCAPGQGCVRMMDGHPENGRERDSGAGTADEDEDAGLDGGVDADAMDAAVDVTPTLDAGADAAPDTSAVTVPLPELDAGAPATGDAAVCTPFRDEGGELESCMTRCAECDEGYEHTYQRFDCNYNAASGSLVPLTYRFCTCMPPEVEGARVANWSDGNIWFCTETVYQTNGGGGP